MKKMNDKLLLNIYTVDSAYEGIECDSVILSIADSSDGSFSGSYGIKKGHAETVFSLKKGKTLALNKGENVFSAATSDGFAMVKSNIVNVTVDSLTENN